MKLHFYLRYHTTYGQSLWISTNGELGTDLIESAIPMNYMNDEFWFAEIKIGKNQSDQFRYKYIFKDEHGEIIPEFGNDRFIDISKEGLKEIMTIDTWNHAGEYQNVFYSAPFKNILLKQTNSKTNTDHDKKITHIFKVKAPLLSKNEVVCFAGNCDALGNWDTEKPVLFSKEDDWWIVNIDLTDQNFPLSYKYGIYNKKNKEFIQFESGGNRLLYANPAKKKLIISHDGFARFPNDGWKGAGIAIPVFSLRSKKSFGTGEFSDIKLLADWAKTTGLKLIQILPVNDTTSTYGWPDSYPYAAISAFALHPIYINLEKVAGKKHAVLIKSLSAKKMELNLLPDLDYVEVLNAKLAALKTIYSGIGDDFFEAEEYVDFFKLNKHWLLPYAAFCYLRDKFDTSDTAQWESNSVYSKKDIEKLSSENSVASKEIAFHYFIQFHLHSQLKDAADYAHKKGIVLKGDIAIGVSRHGSDTWMNPELFNLEWQAGAPPDDFAIKGQNWAFPTYNWKKMQKDHFEWWRKRFEQMSNYFDAFRIDHILGFFRIWSIPEHAVEGIMGHFVPAIPITITEFGEKGIWFDYHRFCQPYITDAVLREMFGDLDSKMKSDYLEPTEYDSYDLKPEFDTQKKVEKHFKELEANAENEKIKIGLFDLISNVIMFEVSGSQGQSFHFRIAIDKTTSFRYLNEDQRHKINSLYVNYFFQRQDDVWKKEAMHKLPYLKRATNMLICGEDLGMVPNCVPDVMNQLGILSLEIQRMPKNPVNDFFNPKDAPYLSVITPSTHDMSTIRGWWEEDKSKIASFYNHVLGQWGDAPFYCEPWVNRAIVLQHFYSPAMWSIFQLQDLLGTNEKLRKENPNEERINVPADPNNKWKYRMHLTLEDLIKEKEFNEELKGFVELSGR